MPEEKKKSLITTEFRIRRRAFASSSPISLCTQQHALLW